MLINIIFKSIGLLIFIDLCSGYTITSENDSNYPFVVGVDAQTGEDSLVTLKIADAAVIGPKAVITSDLPIRGYEGHKLYVDCRENSNTGGTRPQVVNVIHSDNREDEYAILILDTELPVKPIQLVKNSDEIDTNKCSFIRLQAECSSKSSKNCVGSYPGEYSKDTLSIGQLDKNKEEGYHQLLMKFVNRIASSKDMQYPIDFDGSPLICKYKNDNNYGLAGLGRFGIYGDASTGVLTKFVGQVIDVVPHVGNIVEKIGDGVGNLAEGLLENL